MITPEQRASTLMAVIDIEKRLTPKKAHKLIVEAFQILIEDCAKLMDRQATGFQILIDHAPTPIRAEDLKRVKHSIEVVAKEIRALAAPKEDSQEKGD